MSKQRPTLRDLRAAAVLMAAKHTDTRYVDRIDELEQSLIRLIQIQDEIKKLEAERGYTDNSTRERHKGLTDKVEELMLRYDLFDGVQIEDYIAYPHAGRAEWIDERELLRLGVTDTIINQAKRSKQWSTVMIRKLGSSKEPK